MPRVCVAPVDLCPPPPPAGSPGQLSPVSTASYGPAPTIPSAPTSPRGFDMSDLQQRFATSLSAAAAPPGRYGLPPRADSVGAPAPPLSPAGGRTQNGIAHAADACYGGAPKQATQATSSRDTLARRYKEPIYPP